MVLDYIINPVTGQEDITILPSPVSTIIASFRKEKIIELCGLDEHRGHYAHSVGMYDADNCGMFSVNRGGEGLPFNKLHIEPFEYCIVHLQSTPCGKNIQPAAKFINTLEGGSHNYLWLNGELSPEAIEKIQIEEDTKDKWHPYLLLRHIIRYGAPSNIIGSFSGIYSDGIDLYLFRNDLAPMFIDEEMNICSTPFVGSTSTPPNRMLRVDLKEKKLEEVDIFSTVRPWI